MKKLVVALLLLFISCQNREKPVIAFYYWKTIFKLSEIEKQTILENQVKKLYIRYFDIDLDAKNQAFPESPVCFESEPFDLEIVPVVYIKNKVFLSKNFNSLNLAQKVNDYIDQINCKNNISSKEIQIDCDWTLASKDNYLKFIEDFREISSKKLSATIRLHQIKYFKKTGIPNVDQGILMYYNMGTIAADSLNSIYDKNIANRYLESLCNYPLSLSIAVPIYSWAVQSRDRKVIALKNKLSENSIKNDTNFIKISKKEYKVKHSNYKAGSFYKADDLLKIEAITPDELLEIANDLKNNLKENPKEIIFYDLDQFNIKNYEKDIFKKVSSRF